MKKTTRRKKMKWELQKVYDWKDKALLKVAPAVATGWALVAGNAYALDWPPTSTEIASAFTSLVTTLGEIIAAVATAGLVLYGGYVGIMFAIQFFSKFLRTAKSGA
jgi:hypothetical protein